MALRVWLPLNGDLENKGISNISISTNNFSINNLGKLGKCYQGYGLTHLSQEILNNNWSVALWVKETSVWSQYNQILFCKNLKDSSDCQIYFSIVNGKSLNLGINGPSETGSYNYNFNLNTWYHVAATYDGLNYCLYINGILVKTGTCTTAFNANKLNLGFGCRSVNDNATSGTGQTNTQCFNDFRLYDHCLSPLEVKEISQGLILHYKLDGFSGGAGENILTNSTGNLGNTANWSGLVTRGIENNESYLIARRTDTTSSSRTFCTHSAITSLVNTWKPGDKFTISGYYKIPSSENYEVTGNMFIRWTYTTSANSYADTGFSTSLTDTKDTWIRFEKTYTVPNNYVDGAVNFYLSAFSKGLSTIYWKKVKLEKNSIATSWTPTLSEMGINTTKIVDSSGYENDGSILSTLSTTSDTERYEISTSFNGTDSGILIEDLNISNIINNAVTYSFWIKPNGENGARSIYFGSFNSTSWSIEKTTGNLLRLYWNGSPDETCTGATITDGIWQHVCITKNGSNDVKVYINGVQKWTSTAAHNTLTFPTTYRIGRDTRSGDNTPYKGLMSDFRIYATALSAEDIATLYHTPAQIDNLGGIHGFEFEEEGEKDSIYKNGIVSTGQVKNYLVNNFAETNTLTDWTFTSPTISNGIVTTTGTGPAITSKTFTVNPNDIIVVKFTLSMPTPSTSTSGQGLYLGTQSNANTNRYLYNFNTHTWGQAQSNASSSWNTYFLNGYNSTESVTIQSYILGSNVNIANVPDAYCSLSSILSTNAIQLTSGTTTNIRSGYNSGNTTMVIQLSNFEIYNLKEKGVIQEEDNIKTGLGYIKYSNFIEK